MNDLIIACVQNVKSLINSIPLTFYNVKGFYEKYNNNDNSNDDDDDDDDGGDNNNDDADDNDNNKNDNDKLKQVELSCPLINNRVTYAFIVNSSI